MQKVIATLAFAVALSGCASHNYLKDQYSASPRTIVTTEDDRFGVWELPAERKLLVMVQRGGNTGFLLNPSFSSYAKPHFERAARSYFEQSGRRCEPYEGAAILEQRWEFKYRCEAGT